MMCNRFRWRIAAKTASEQDLKKTEAALRKTLLQRAEHSESTQGTCHYRISLHGGRIDKRQLKLFLSMGKGAG